MSDTRPMVDANILVYSHNRDSPLHLQAKALLTELIEENGFYLNSLVLQEFFSVITDGRKIEKPLGPDSALSIINDICKSENIKLLSVREPYFFLWLESFMPNVRRYQIYDAFIAYTMYRNNVRDLYTNNIKDFKKFDFIQAINPLQHGARSMEHGAWSMEHGAGSKAQEVQTSPLPAPGSMPSAPCPSRTIPYGKQSITEQDVAAVCSVLRSDFLTQGPKVPEFEQTIATYCQAKYAIAVNSGTSALHIACLALGLGPGDILWTSPITFVASANCALYCGAEIDFVDIDPHTYNLSPAALEQKLYKAKKENRLPKVVVPVHLCGHPCDMKAIWSLSREFGFRIIEDACHAIGGTYKTEPIGNCRYSDISIFSFHPVKGITSGEGGMAVTNDPEVDEQMKLLRSHGITRDPKRMTQDPDGPWYYQQIGLGYNYRMTDIQAALGMSQARKLQQFVSKRAQLAARYDELLRDLPIKTPKQNPEGTSGWHLYVIRLQLDNIAKSKRQVFEFLREKGIGMNIHYIPVHTQPWFQHMGFQQGMFPEAEKYYQEAITLPLFPSMTEEDQDTVIATLQEALQA